MSTEDREVNANLPVDILRTRLRDKIEHLTKKMRKMRRDPKGVQILSAAKGELAVAKRRLAALEAPKQYLGGE